MVRITKETVFTQSATMFGDGAKGYFMQTYSLSADGQDLGIGVTVEGHKGRNDVTRAFTTKNGSFPDIIDALLDAGHDIDDDVLEHMRGEK